MGINWLSKVGISPAKFSPRKFHSQYAPEKKFPVAWEDDFLVSFWVSFGLSFRGLKPGETSSGRISGWNFQGSSRSLVFLRRFFFWWNQSHDGSMGRTDYVPTWKPEKSTIHVGKYTVRPMDPMGINCFKPIWSPKNPSRGSQWRFSMQPEKSWFVEFFFLRILGARRRFDAVCRDFFVCMEPKWPLFLKVNPPKQGLFQSKQGSVGFQMNKSHMW